MGPRVAIAVLLVAARSYAQPATELQHQGEDAAKRGDFALAIDKFKAADRIETRASHACLIALAYTRRNLWSQAEIFRTVCHDRANADDPLPDWMAEADRQIDTAIAAANVAAVTIAVEPASANVRLTVSSFAPDETFGPRIIHLAPGTHQIFATAPGFESAQRLVDIRDKTPVQITIPLRPLPAPAPQVLAPPPRPLAPWIVVGGGVALGLVGGVLQATWYKHRYDQVETDVPDTEAADVARWRSARQVVIGCYVGGAVTIAAGLVLRATVWKDAPAIAVTPTEGGGMVSIGWQR